MEQPTPIRYALLVAAGLRCPSLPLHDHLRFPLLPHAPTHPFQRLDTYAWEQDEEQPDDGLLPVGDEGEGGQPVDDPGEQGDAQWVIPTGWSYSAQRMPALR